MLTKENNFYKTLLFMAIGLLMLDAEVIPEYRITNLTLLNLLVLFVVLSQFYMNRWKLKMVPFAYFLINGFYLPKITAFNGLMMPGGVSWEVAWKLVYLIPVIYTILNFRIWYPELVKASKSFSADQLKHYEFIPFATTVVMGLCTYYHSRPFATKSGLQNFTADFAFGTDASSYFERLFGQEFFIFIIVLALVFAARKNITFGFWLLGWFALQAVLFFVDAFVNSLFEPSQFPLSLTLNFETGMLFFIPPVLALALYWMNFNKQKQLTELFRKGETVQPDERPLITIEEFKAAKKHLLLKEAFVLGLFICCLGIYLFFTGLFNEYVNGLLAVLGFVLVAGGTLFYAASRAWKIAGAISGIAISGLVFLVLLYCSFDQGSVVGQLAPGFGLLMFFSIIVLLIWGLPVLFSLSNDNGFVKFVLNRDGSRMFNQQPDVQFQKIEVDQKVIDNYADELIPWKKRRVTTIIFLSIQSLTVIALPYLSRVLLIYYSRPDASTIFLHIAVSIILIALITALIKWAMILNRALCISMLSLYGLGLLSMVYTVIKQGQLSLSYVVSFLIYFAFIFAFSDAYGKLIKRKRGLDGVMSKNDEILDSLS